MKTQSKPTAKRAVSKVRQNISINPKVLKSAQKVAARQGLSFSGWNEQLIRAELKINS
jgi:predicted HicB family RNase H-like nuclease